MKKIPLLVLMFIAVLLPLTAGGKQESSADGSQASLTAYVSILPQAYFLERIIGDRGEVEVMVLPGKSPATYEPTPQQVVQLGEADVFFTIGVPFEKSFLPSIEGSLPNLLLSDTSRSIKKRHLGSHSHEEEDHHEGHHEADEDHHEKEMHDAGNDPHVWMSPALAVQISQNMAETLIQIDPEGAALYKKNLKALVMDLETLDASLAKVLAPVKGEILFVYHPAFGYFADRYGMTQEAIETGGKEPSPAALEHIIHKAKDEGVHIILVQPEFSQSSAKTVADAIDGSVVEARPLAKDYLNSLKLLADEISEELKE